MFNFIRKKKKTDRDTTSMPTDIKQIIMMLTNQEIESVEKEIAKISLYYCLKVEGKTVDPYEVSSYFLDLDQAIDASSVGDKLRKEVRYLLLQGILFKEYGTKYGPDLNFIKELSTKILSE